MTAILACQNDPSSAPRIACSRHRANRYLVPVLALLVLLCGMSPFLRAQTAYYAGVMGSPISTGYFTEVEGMATDASGNLFIAATNGTTWTVYEFAYNATTQTYSGTPVALNTPAGGYPCSGDPCLRGVAVDSNGNLWVADFAGGSAGQVYELTPSAGSFASATPAAVGTGWVDPWAITADKSGNVFVTDYTPNTITEITGGIATVVNTGGVSAPRGIAVDASGNLFVVDGNTSQVMELVAPGYTTVNIVSPGFQGPGDLAFDASGNLWVSEYSTNSASEMSGWNSSGPAFTTLSRWGSGLNGPVAVWPSADGAMIVSDLNDGSIKQINFQQPRTFSSTAIGSSSATQSFTFAFPVSTTIASVSVVTQGQAGHDFVDAGTGDCAATTYAVNATCSVDVKFAPKTPGSRAGAVVLVDGSGNVAEAFLSGTATGPEVVFNPNLGSSLLSTLASPGVPEKMALDAKGNIFVADSNLGRLWEIPAGGGTPVQIATAFSGTPYGMAIDGAGNLFVGNTNGNTVDEILAPAYTTVNVLPPVFGGSPAGLVVDASGNLYVAESPNGGSALVEVATAASGYATVHPLSSSLTNPFGIAVDWHGNIFVADEGTGSVTELNSSGGLVGTYGSFSQPVDVAVDAADNIYVAEKTGGAITELTKASSYATPITLATTANEPAGVALDNNGNVYYSTNASDNSIYEIDLADAASLNFGNTTPYKTASAAQSVTVSNIGNANLTFTNVSAAPGDFAPLTSAGDCVAGTPVTTGNSCSLSITFTPQSLGTLISGTANLADNTSSASQIVNLSGTGVKADVTLSWTPSTNTIPYGTDLSGVLPATASCTGCGTFSYTASGVGAVSSGTILGVAGSPYTLTATFTLTDTTHYNPPSSSHVTANLTVTKATTTVSTLPSASAITYGQTLASSNLTGGSVVSGSSSVTGHWAFTTPTTAPTAGTDSESVTFTPDDTADYDTVTGSVNVVVSKATTTVSALPSASAITYGQTLASSNLTGGSVVSGSSPVTGHWAFTAPTTAPTAGTDSEGVTFTPDDTTDYDTVTGSVNVVVNKATPTISVLPNASAITYGQTLASSTLSGGSVVSGSNPVLGTWTYDSPTTVPTAGTDSESVTFTPTDQVDYNLATGSVNVVVNKATPTITWNSPASIVYGTALSATQLNASSTVDGTYAYTPAAGTILSAGSGQTLSVTLTPNDTVDYTTATATTTINVTNATLTITVNSTSRAYGAPNPTFTGTVVGLQNGDTVTTTYSTTATLTSDVGPWPITATISGAKAANYTASVTPGTLTITKTPLTIAVNSATRVYDTANPTFTGTITGLLNGDTVTPSYTTTATLSSPAGTYPITATIAGAKAGDYNPTVTPGTLTITQATTTVTWAAPAAIIYGTPLSATQLDATASVAGSFAYTPAAGTILPVGANQVLSVTFTPTDGIDYKSSTGTTTISVGSTGLTVIAKNASRVYGAANPTFTGTITGAQGGDTFTESFTTSATTASAVGTYPIVPSASGPNLGNYTVVIDNGILTIAKANTTTGLSASGNSVNPGASVTLTATVASATSGTPTGTVNFYNSTTLLGTGTLSGGVATYSTTSLAAGSSNTITAVYSGDSNFNSSSTTTSTGITVGVLDFTLGAPTPSSLSGKSGASFQYSFSVSPLYGSYAGPVSFTATGLPTGAVATFSPSTIPANGGAQTVNMSVSTTPASAALIRPSTAGRGLIPVAMAFLLLPLAGTKRMRREGRRFGRLACLLFLLLAGLGATTALTGCGSHGGLGGAVEYTITVTATSGSVQHTSAVTLDLQ